ncbi:nucleotide exchange factor GrpE [Paenibacillus sp. SC116]|nr:nucleotide exchange factor GrpE [Paenibacillus sp. SC116]MCR8845823.1 nucleotide exchange factor GrpE [Paenibacillus sp. SC116]
MKELKQEQDANLQHDEQEATAFEQEQTETAAEVGGEESNDLQGAVEQAKAEAEENYQRMLRVQADYDNFRRRTLKEKEDLAKYASSKLVTDLVPILDNFERALSTNPSSDSDSFSKGVDMIFRQFQQVLEQEGVTAIKAVGEPFNPEYHQAIMQVESDEYEEGIVVEELQKGYMLKDRVVRPAMVKVSS